MASRVVREVFIEVDVTVLGLVGGARAAPWGGHTASPIHRRRARAASFIAAYSRTFACLLVSYMATAVPSPFISLLSMTYSLPPETYAALHPGNGKNCR